MQVDDYAAMMDDRAERPVRFTNKGDDAVVLFNFFKMSIGLRIKEHASELEMAMREVAKLAEQHTKTRYESLSWRSGVRSPISALIRSCGRWAVRKPAAQAEKAPIELEVSSI